MISIDSTWADNYFANRLYSDAWNNASIEQQSSALSMAGYIIDGAFVWKQAAYTVNREGIKTFADQIKAAICEQAIWSIQNNIFEYPEVLTKGFIEAEGGPDISITLDKEYVLPFLCRAAISLVGDLGTLADPVSKGSMIIRDIIRGI